MDIGPYRGVTAADRTENDLHHRRWLPWVHAVTIVKILTLG